MAEQGMIKRNKNILYDMIRREGHGPEGVIGDTQNEQTMIIAILLIKICKCNYLIK